MKKLLGILVIVLAAVCIISPKIIAGQYQKQLESFIAYLNQSAGYHAKIESMDNSWFGSKANISVEVDPSTIDPNSPIGSIKANIILDTHYGPLLFNKQSLIGLYSTQASIPADKARDTLVWDDNKPLYQLNITRGLTGNLTMADAIPSFTDKAKTLLFSGYSGSGENKNNTFHYQGALKNINIDDQQPASLKDLSVKLAMDTSVDLNNGGLRDSDMTLKVGDIQVASKMAIKGLSINTHSDLDKKTQLGDIKISYGADSFSLPSVQVTNLSLVTELKNLNNAVLTKIYKELNNAPDGTDPTNQKTIAVLQDNLGPFLASKPEFNISDFSGTLPEGSFKSSLTSKLADINDPKVEDLFNPQFWKYYTISTANILVDAPLADKLAQQFVAKQAQVPVQLPQVKQQAQMIIGNFVQQGLIKKEKDQYRTEISIKDGQLSVNNIPLPM
ncbi:YdgA family protein [Marinomonas spartinae]|uniref:YdgA family protein n=1 Tax=Marinomonas spartinae TaxID=1792290 RepID=UPI0018F20580|nr:DUF945 family protein [Marinomonas spartinae]MBJ7555869.1 DUF945 family protein [Marinomonas spartinae]